MEQNTLTILLGLIAKDPRVNYSASEAREIVKSAARLNAALERELSKDAPPPASVGFRSSNLSTEELVKKVREALHPEAEALLNLPDEPLYLRFNRAGLILKLKKILKVGANAIERRGGILNQLQDAGVFYISNFSDGKHWVYEDKAN